MSVIPVQYDILKPILSYMNPNKRFQISLRMPSISSLESSITLKIENLTFTRMDTKVNEVSYRLGVYRDYGRNETPYDVLRMNQGGGSSDDIDQYGLIIFSGVNNVLPGDIDLRTVVHPDGWFNTDESEQNVVQQLRVFKMLLAERLNQEYIEDDETRNAGVGGPLNDLIDSYREITLNASAELIQSRIQSLQDRLRAFSNRRNNQNLPYTALIQLSVYSSKGRQIQRVAYNKYLYEARRTVHTKLFGNRGSNISVKNLKIEPHSPFSNHILRFPAGTILKIENLEVSHWNSLAFESFKNVIHPSSFPIQRLKISSSISTADFRHIIAREPKRLIISNNTKENCSWTPILSNLTNRRVYLENENRLNPPNNYMDLIENWLQQGRPFGTCFYMGIKNEETVKQCLETLRQREEVVASSEKQVQLRINASLILEVCYEMAERRERLQRNGPSKWWLRLRVVRGRDD
ncbi:hypothetical protein GCK72_003832 [Caenorhabditis remanei]|uniref:F-box C protein n=1 Tax=Caenorhabditis remanei TaxID=31234 RepID=A0A6A5HAL3_CAERE|nr:hypothetical protein GCK72_003832 [Caenorhabditis remanei]KAF1763886.1 hypothetical protein GCK72_003832 [Caenorhabditis remanei]